MITLALTHWNRFELLREAIIQVQDDPRISEIVIVDDASDDGSYQMIVNEYWTRAKFRVYRNDENLDSYANKARAVELSEQPWVILFDSDNIMSPVYLDALFSVEWMPWHIYLPDYAEPDFDYRQFSGQTITRENVAEYMKIEIFKTALNTGNYLVPRDEYLKVWDPLVEPHTSEPIYHNLRWLEAGGSLTFVEGLRYFHRIHDGSHFMRNVQKTGAFAYQVEEALRELR